MQNGRKVLRDDVDPSYMYDEKESDDNNVSRNTVFMQIKGEWDEKEL